MKALPQWVAWAIIAAVFVLLVILLATHTHGEPIGRRPCFEDEAVLWTGDAHTLCVPLDELADWRLDG